MSGTRAAACSIMLVIVQVPGQASAGPLYTQALPAVQYDTLPSPDAALSRGFTALTSVVELSDGRILLSDPREQSIVVADFATQGVEAVSRTGGGPGEYRIAMPIRALGRSRAIMVDGLSRRWLLFEGSDVTQTLTSSHSAVQEFGNRFPYGVDSLGHILTTEPGPRADSARLVLYSRGEASSQIVGALYLPDSELPGGLASYEKAFLAIDGWIAVLRIEPYRVDWRRPDGTWIRGSPLPHPPDPLDRADRERLGQNSRYEGINWPEHWPPSAGGYQLLPSLDGSVLIRRSRPTRETVVRYDVVDRNGNLEVQLQLPLNQHILGFGRETVYSVARDEFDLQYVRRHRWRTWQE